MISETENNMFYHLAKLFVSFGVPNDNPPLFFAVAKTRRRMKLTKNNSP